MPGNKDAQLGGSEKAPERTYTPQQEKILLEAMPKTQKIFRGVRNIGGLKQKDLDVARSVAHRENVETLVSQLAEINELTAQANPTHCIAVCEEILTRFDEMLNEKSKKPTGE